MRNTCDVFIEIDIIRAIENNIPFFISENSVILSPGVDGVLSKEFFRIVKSKNYPILFSIKYNYVILVNYDNQKTIKSFDILDLSNKDLINNINFENIQISELEKFENLTFYLKEKKLFKEKICIGLLKENEKIYIDFINQNFKNMSYRSFYNFYIIHDNNFLKEQDYKNTNEDFTKIFDSKNQKRIDN